MKLEVLVLDDEPVVCTRLKPALEKEGYTVEVFTDSRQARDRIAEHRFDIVVTDLKMSGIDGMQLYRFVRETWPDAKVLIITGFATVDVTQEALQEGVQAVIAKPFKIADLKDAIGKLAADMIKRE